MRKRCCGRWSTAIRIRRPWGCGWSGTVPGFRGWAATSTAPVGAATACTPEAKYRQWLKQRFTLEQLSQRLGMRYHTWEDVAAPQTKNLLMAMLLFRQFLYENVAQILKWQVEIVRSLDPKHELHSHGFRYNNPLDERCAQECDSWGFASHSTNLFASEDPYQYSNIAYASQWSRAVGKNHQWWYTEIYSGFYHGGMTYRKQTLPEDLAMCLWMGLIYGAKGAIFWQYRPEYGTHEAPGLNLVTMSGKPLPQLKAIEKAIGSIRSMESHLPLKIPRAEVAIAYDSDNAIVMEMENAKGQQLRFIRGIHRSLWENNIPVDLVTTRMDWSGYKLVFLPQPDVADRVDNRQDPAGPAGPPGDPPVCRRDSGHQCAHRKVQLRSSRRADGIAGGPGAGLLPHRRPGPA